MVKSAEEIKKLFQAVADKSANAEIGTLIAELGDLLCEQLTTLTTNQDVYINEQKQLREEFQQLSTLVLERLQNNETHYAERVELFVDRAHNLSNRYMIVEDKVDELAQYLDLSMQELKELLAQILGVKRDT